MITSQFVERGKHDRARDMFPNLPPHLARLAYALIDEGLCFLTCSPDCKGTCVKAAERAILELPLAEKQ